MSALPTPATYTVQTLKTLRADRRGPVLFIELNTPDQGNTVTDTLLDELLAVLDEQDPDIRVIVLSGAGTDFCLGGDRTEFAEQLTDDPTGSAIRVSGTKARRVCEALTNNPAVTIARIQGKAIGAGLALALACDLRVGADTATFRLPELALGLPLAWGGLLPRLLAEVGAARVRELFLTSRAFTAHEAQALSILQNVVPEQELDAAVTAWAKPILRRSPAALRVTKLLFNAHAAGARLADASTLDSELMASVLAEAEYTRTQGQRRTGHLI
ncbi:enoyl-CoA hydratase/isomerase family protein [Streptomyces glomeratus]|uniref:Enoyl-CoA hydratase n=1 Tax=Streptomyces glomeratus TaxID=284452 RepID=A0ABP6M3V8_9ACTN|nr:enoyl-CoA hydratase/isomerase family protein [Streptomyces glomeratus]MCF1511810.1 enoyl-CoA hydratase/isomerase family protein [Streptomyces glomeratus]